MLNEVIDTNFLVIAIIFAILCVVFEHYKKDKQPKKLLPIDKCLGIISSDIDCMNGRDFEEFMAYVFELTGNKVKLTSATRDGGVDIILNRDTYVECKRYSDGNLVGSPILQKLVGACICNNKKSGIVITTSNYTIDANAVAESLKNKDFNLKLWTKKDVLNLCKHCEPKYLMQYLGYDINDIYNQMTPTS